MVGWNYSESYNLRVELNQMGLGRGVFFFFGGRASININQPPSTFHTSTFAARGPRVHLPWPLVTISSSNDGFPQVTGREIQGQKSPMLLQSNCASKTSPLRFPAGLVLKQIKQITNSMFSTDFSFFFIIKVISSQDTFGHIQLRFMLACFVKPLYAFMHISPHFDSLRSNPSPIIRNSL